MGKGGGGGRGKEEVGEGWRGRGRPPSSPPVGEGVGSRLGGKGWSGQGSPRGLFAACERQALTLCLAKPACCFVLLLDSFPTLRKARGAFVGVSFEKGQVGEAASWAPSCMVPERARTGASGSEGGCCALFDSEGAPWVIHVTSIPPRGGPRLGGQAPTFALLSRLKTIPKRMCVLGNSSLQNCIFSRKCHRLVPFFLFPLMVCGRGRG